MYQVGNCAKIIRELIWHIAVFPLSETKFEIDKLNSKIREATKNKSPTLTANQFGVASTLLAN